MKVLYVTGKVGSRGYTYVYSGIAIRLMYTNSVNIRIRYYLQGVIIMFAYYRVFVSLL